MKGDLENLLNAANQLHYNLLFTLEKANKKGNLAFSDINVVRTSVGTQFVDGIKNQLIQGLFLNLVAALNLTIRKTYEESTFHPFFRSISTWNMFDEATKVKKLEQRHSNPES